MGSHWSKSLDEKSLKFTIANPAVSVVKGYPPNLLKMSLTETGADGIKAGTKTLK